jgi:protein-disulfide isomerase
MHLKIFSKMKISKLLIKTILLLFLLNNKTIAIELNSHTIGKENSAISIEIFSSFTCPHCAKLHLNILPDLIKKYTDTGRAKITLKDFPLDLAALNASKIEKCIPVKNKLKFHDTIYLQQSEWASGSNIEEINQKLKKISSDLGISNEIFNSCLNDPKNEEFVLQTRIEAQKKFNINATPTIVINNKKYNGDYTISAISKYIEKIN